MAELYFLEDRKKRKKAVVAKAVQAVDRNPDDLSEAEKQLRERYVDGIIAGMDRKSAALYAGCPKNSAAQRGAIMYFEPYVQHRLYSLREALKEEQIVTRKELLVNLKSIAISESQRASDRISATVAIAKIAGYEAPTKTANLHLIQGGVMLVPVAGSTTDWESAAKAAQDRLKEDVRK